MVPKFSIADPSVQYNVDLNAIGFTSIFTVPNLGTETVEPLLKDLSIIMILSVDHRNVICLITGSVLY